MQTEEEYIKKNCPFVSRKMARKMYRQYQEIENTVNDCRTCPKAPAPWWPTVSNLCVPCAPSYNCDFEFASITVDCPAPTKKVGWKVNTEQEQGNKPMTDSEVTRNYLVQRLETASRTKRNELSTIFNLYANTQPKTYKDLIDWVKNDKFKIDDKTAKRIDVAIADEGEYYGSFLDGIVWTGAENVPDQDGYTAAEKERTAKVTAVKDVIYTADSATALKALQDFEAWTPGPTTTAQ